MLRKKTVKYVIIILNMYIQNTYLFLETSIIANYWMLIKL